MNPQNYFGPQIKNTENKGMQPDNMIAKFKLKTIPEICYVNYILIKLLFKKTQKIYLKNFFFPLPKCFPNFSSKNQMKTC